MSTLRLATAANIRAFQFLIDALAASKGKWTERLDGDALEDEIGRFRVWAGNLGALQKGHSSLDYRLRDSPNLLSSALELLKELEHNLNETYAVVSGARLPYEAQTPTNEKVEEDENDDGFFSEEDDSDSDEPRNELKMRFEEVVDIIDNLYKLSVRIRTPSIRSRSLKASSYTPTDPETGVDILGAYAELDRKHVHELLSHLRKSHLADNREEQDFVIERLSSSITLRRRHFKYWKRHRDKLGAPALSEEEPEPGISALQEPLSPVRKDNLEAHPAMPMITTSRPTPSQKTGKTLLSGTEATHHHQSLDDIVDTKSVTSYAVTVRDLHGKGIDLPSPPKAANGDKDFECPYCWIVCPARYGKGRAWKTHLLQDLQPYICTYQNCENPSQLFRSRREWAEHEATHRKLWRCPEHATALYSSHSGLENHLRQDHNGSFPQDQIAIIANIGETTALDTRTKCPICYAPAETEGLGDLQNHIANHLERFATFALPHGREDDSEGASSVASRGSSNSQFLPDSVRTDTSNDVVAPEDALESEYSYEPQHVTDPGRGLLSAESLQQLPDESQNRLAMISGQVNDPNDSEDEQPDDQQLDNNILPAHREHLDEQEAFRQHILTLPGALSVRFYRRYGSWNGLITFADDWIGEEALTVFDTQRFPNIKFQSKKDTSKWKFSRTSGTNRKDNIFNRQSTMDTQTTEDADILSSASELYDEEDQETSKQAIISAAEIPTLRSLYQSRRLLQRDQSFAPNDAYNQIISFCHYDLTRLRVDAIVNNAPVNFKAPPTPDSLHHSIFKAGGSGLRKEARSKARVKAGQVALTHGHALPSSWVIHAAAPTYTGSKGVGQFNVLSECYRSALRMAATYELKTVAFPCLGTGGCNFPPRVAARIALQEVREYLDVHPEHRPDRIIFCVRAVIDEKAYTDFLPVFFPPTHGDLDRARTSDWSVNRAALSAQILEARLQLQKALTNMSDTYVFGSQSTACAHDMRRVDSALTSIRNYLLGSKELKRSLGDLNLLCSVVLTACASISEVAEQAVDMGFAKEAQSLWHDTNTLMQAKHGFDLPTLFDYCWMFANSLDDVIARDTKEPDAMARTRQVLENYGVKQKGQDVQGIRDHIDEVIYARESERHIPNNRKVIQVHQIPSVARLYLLGHLEAKPTMAQPSTPFNHVVCLERGDITRLGVDVMINSTDVSFSGMGTLDRSVFKKGGSELCEEVKAFGKCEEGDVKVTPGYLLPAKHIFHVVPPGQFRKDTKSILRNIYREILHTAVEMKATSVAIPGIGTGMLNYPQRDCASLAIEEVKRFLESAEPGNGLGKIIFVVFSSNDEVVYKSLLPIYFPPPKGKAPDEPQREQRPPVQHQAAMNLDGHMRRETEPEEEELEMRDELLTSSVQHLMETQGIPSSYDPLTQFELDEEDKLLLRLKEDEGLQWTDILACFQTDLHKDYSIATLQTRLKRLEERTYVPRPMDSDEEDALIQFESHVNYCNVCSDGLFEGSHKLCEQGYPLAQTILQRMRMTDDANVFGKVEKRSDRDKNKLELPTDRFPSSMLLLSMVAKHIQLGNTGIPFHEASKSDTARLDELYMEHSSLTIDPDLSVQATESPAAVRVKVLPPFGDRKWVYSWIRVHKSKVDMYSEDYDPDSYGGPSEDVPYESIHLEGAAAYKDDDDVPIVSLWTGQKGRSSRETWHFRSVDTFDSGALLKLLRRAIERTAEERRSDVAPEVTAAADSAPATEPPAVIRAAVLAPQRSGDWVYSLLHVYKSKIKIYAEETYPEHDPYATVDLAGASSSLTQDATLDYPNAMSLFVERLEKSKGKGKQKAEAIRLTETWHFLGAGAFEAAALFSVLQRAVNRNSKTQRETVPPTTEKATGLASIVAPAAQVGNSGETPDADAYPQWNQRLRDVKDNLVDKQHEDGGIQHISKGTPSSSGDISNEWRHFLGRQKLRVQILDYLVNDLRTRPGSYIGQKTDSIASGISIDTESATSLLHELAAQGRVHNTVDDDTWVISEQISEFTVNEQEKRPAESSDINTDALADQILLRMNGGESVDDIISALRVSGVAFFPVIMNLLAKHFIASLDEGSWDLTDLGRERAVEIQTELAKAEQEAARDTGSIDPDKDPSSDLSERALSYLRSLPGISENISDLATAVDTPVAELQPVLEQLGSEGLVENKNDGSSWTAKILPDTGSKVEKLPIQLPLDPAVDPTAAQLEETPEMTTEPASSSSRDAHGNIVSPGSWRNGKGARKRKQTRSSRALAEDIEEDMESGTAGSLRSARIARETLHNKSSRARADDIEDELEYYDGQEEDYVKEDEEPLKG